MEENMTEKKKLILSWGFQQWSSDVTAVWGARMIFPDDLLGDRAGFAFYEGESNEDSLERSKTLKRWLTTRVEWEEGRFSLKLPKGTELTPVNWMCKYARYLADRHQMDRNSDGIFRLYQDQHGHILGSPQRSCGYLYVAAWLGDDKKTKDAFDLADKTWYMWDVTFRNVLINPNMPMFLSVRVKAKRRSDAEVVATAQISYTGAKESHWEVKEVKQIKTNHKIQAQMDGWQADERNVTYGGAKYFIAVNHELHQHIKQKDCDSPQRFKTSGAAWSAITDVYKKREKDLAKFGRVLRNHRIYDKQ